MITVIRYEECFKATKIHISIDGSFNSFCGRYFGFDWGIYQIPDPTPMKSVCKKCLNKFLKSNKVNHNKVKRKMIASMFFDSATADSAMDSPCVTLFWDCENSQTPIVTSIRYGMESVTTNHTFPEVHKFMLDAQIRSFAAQQVIAHFPNYSGNFENDINNEFHLSEFGRAVCAANNQNQVEAWIK